ncbi:M48 family metalloprotease [Hoeflea prorocentri]|uniref:M48 family metalloprotease n=1 Tax=Hoeflea prorocentri TaxID=1922333 RepID=A0A9X3UL17_9HYPH|nr:M48 family metalloprotease [Hoeflea prorocentri]MCY6382526.1 M48 family metalloprotease [Hoeflea prorocentri]MDA5400326.1 M48 family metalloprotease [Hoeflea prorocentri]
MDKDDWSVDLAQEAFGILEAAFPGISRYQISVLHNPAHAAFTADGNHIFLTRTLLELCATVEMAAFVIAHEIAHHELGHIPRASKRLKGRLRVLAYILQSFVSPITHARREIEADTFAIDMCMAAGLSGEKCVQTFQVLEKASLDRGGVGSAYGIHAFYCDEMTSIQRRWRIGFYLLRYHGYYPVRVRRVLAEKHVGMDEPPYNVFLF